MSIIYTVTDHDYNVIFNQSGDLIDDITLWEAATKSGEHLQKAIITCYRLEDNRLRVVKDVYEFGRKIFHPLNGELTFSESDLEIIISFSSKK